MDPTLGSRLRAARLMARSLSTRELDRLAGLTPGHTSAIETGGRPNVEVRTAGALAGVLGVSLDWLVWGNGRGPSGRAVGSSVEHARVAFEAKTKTSAA